MQVKVFAEKTSYKHLSEQLVEKIVHVLCEEMEGIFLSVDELIKDSSVHAFWVICKLKTR